MKHLLMSASLMAALVAPAFSGEAKVNWQQPEKFTDIRSGNETREGFQARVFKDFGQMFADLAKKLPDGYQLDITVTDLDLAGDVNGMHAMRARDIRIIKELYWPRMSFSYTLKDASNALVASGKEELKDMNFMSRVGIQTGNSSFNYEETMLRDWFNKQQKENIFPKK
jgi:hypothetical protein